MSKHTYKIIEVVGSSSLSIEDAIQTAIANTAKTIRHMGWFEVVATRGHVENGIIAHFQVTIKIGFTIEEPAQT